MPAFAVFFPVEVAVAATAVVHFANNIFKAFLVGRHMNLRVILLFGVPGILGALGGAYFLSRISVGAPLANYQLFGVGAELTVVKLVVAILILCFAAIELWPRLAGFSIDKKFLPLGGVVAGFFGGLSGHQGALRSAFLSRVGLSKEAFVGTMIIAAVLVDMARLYIYGTTFLGGGLSMLEGTGIKGPLLAGTACAFAGSFIGTRLLKKVTITFINKLVGVMLFVFGLLLGLGII